MSGAPYKHVTVYTRRGVILLLVVLCQGIGIQCVVPLLGKVLFMYDQARYRGLRQLINVKSYQGKIYTKALSTRGAENFMQAG
jgi:hypothetical protein